jgi:drug/metabolite transporter (DMT)-like permease
VQEKPDNNAIVVSLFLSVFLWGANNAGTKYLVKFWPPILVGAARFLVAGLVMLALLRWTKLLGRRYSITPDLKRRLWWKGGLSLALYIVAFNWALKLTSVSHVALYLGAAPVWALLWEGRPQKHWKSIQRYGAAALAFCGVLVLFWPIMRHASSHTLGEILGEILGLASSVLWTNFGRQCGFLGRELSGPEVAAQSFWRAGVLILPIAVVEIFTASSIPLRSDLVLVQLFCALGGGVVAFAFWTNALRHWKTSQVYLFNNLVPLSTMAWANLCLGERITSTFWMAMILIGSGVVIGQAPQIRGLKLSV